MRAVRYTALIVAFAFSFWIQSALSCGHCVEDKVAAVYDHAVVVAALARKHQVAFFAVDGRLSGSEAERRAIELAAKSAQGVDPGTVRASSELAALSVAFDPARVSFATLQRSLEHKLMRRGFALLPLRVIDKPGEFRAVADR